MSWADDGSSLFEPCRSVSTGETLIRGYDYGAVTAARADDVVTQTGRRSKTTIWGGVQ